MKFFPRVLFCALFCLAFILTSGHCLSVPERPEGYVTDLAGLLSVSTKLDLEKTLHQFEKETSNQLVVAIFSSLEGEAIEDFSIRLAEKWKIGQKEKNNGVILLIVKDDRAMRIEVGYGLEGVLPDALASTIINSVATPHFSRNEYDLGVVATINAIMKATKGEYTTNLASQINWKILRLILIYLLIVAIGIFLIDTYRYKQYLYDFRIFHEKYTFWEWFIRFAWLVAIISAILRLLFDLAMMSTPGYFGNRSGFGGGGGGGSFSGGGGSFGGGGASGKW